jgi:hypothetical protein
MRIIEQEVLKFEELVPEAQQYAIDKYYENEDYPFLKDDITEKLKEIAKESNNIIIAKMPKIEKSTVKAPIINEVKNENYQLPDIKKMVINEIKLLPPAPINEVTEVVTGVVETPINDNYQKYIPFLVLMFQQVLLYHQFL